LGRPAEEFDIGIGERVFVVAFRNTLTSSSYAVMDSGYKYQYDKYNDTYRWVPLNGDIAGLCVRTDSQRDPWFSPAGLSRGVIKNVVKLSWNPTKTERDEIYKVGVNPVVTFPGEGTILYGDKTLLSRPSAFDRINVRRLFIVLEKSIAKAARSSLFEFNDEFTRAAFVNLVEPFLRDVQGRRGIYDFRVVCDNTNNTAQVIDSNEFIGDIYVKPARSINYIQLNFVAVRTGVSFDEVVGQF
jgi:phage tail sheath protein FI